MELKRRKKKGEKRRKMKGNIRNQLKRRKKGKIIVIYDLNLFFLLSSFVCFGSFQRRNF
jgi:hypothetical protein